MDINIHIDEALVATTKRQIRRPMVVAVLGAAVVATVASASPLGSVPNVFAAGDVISASEMNENFEAVVTAIDAVDASLDGLDDAVADLAEWHTVGFKVTGGGTVSNATFSPSPTLADGPTSPYVVTLPAGLFSATPVCTISAAPSNAVAVSTGILPTSATTLEMACAYDFVGGDDGWCNSSLDQFNIICVGPR
jgi:hypothetical protein